MSDGITWLTDAWRGDARILFVTFARGISPSDLVVRLGALPGEVLAPITFAEAERLTFNDRESARVARFGECARWSYAVEQGWPSKAWWAHPDVSAGGIEVLHLTPKPDDPPRECWYYRDGQTVGRFDIGDTPDEGMAFLLPAFEEAGLLEDDVSDEFDSLRATLTALQQYFGLSLPRQEILNGQLPAAVTATVPPVNLGD
ncbi:hypothetical protein [Streptomyces purpurascens]|uniref:hypothetical protein n=1 Tax=Streptomyces purpurascens TaxID=1924 RepID=UPI00167458C3|nr:hypothetical protein [Streptomyces purpurascens]MCE7052982.1 hypothetical protein [Streptomyces purpurascens]GHA59785.1 hypothetical protein GCM10010303_84360 [Streptomyces purpurascens]